MANFDTHSHCARCRHKGKGKEPCVQDPQMSNCQICNSLTSDQRQQLATPSHKLKEKCEAKLTDPTPSQDSDQLVDLSSVSVIGVVDEQGSVKSPAPVLPPDKKPKKDNKNSKKEKSPSTNASKHSTGTDDNFTELDNKWSERFSRLEALIMPNSFEPAFSSKVKVTPTHSPPHDVENVSEPFIQPSTSKLPGSGFSAEKHQPTSKAITSQQTSTTKFPGMGFSANKHQPASQTKSHRLTSTTRFTGQGSSAIVHQPTSQTKINRPTTRTDPSAKLQSTGEGDVHRPYSDRPAATDRPLSSEPADTGSPALHRSRRDSISSLSSEAGSMLSVNPPQDSYTDEGKLTEDQDQTVADPDQPVSEEQNYRDTMQGIHSFMGWSHIPEMDSTASTSDDNPFAGPKTVTPGKVSVKMPTEDWLCRKLAKLNVTLVEGYPSCGSEAGGLAKDVFLRPARTQSKWYGLHTDPKTESSQISSWNTDASKLNSSYGRIAKYTGLSSTPPASRRISQETLRRWERSARETSVICNQAASFNRCLFKVQQNMKDQLKILKAENKGKGSTKASTAAEELNYLMDFNSSITQAAAKSVEHLSEFIFITMGNLTLVRRDAYLSHLRTSIKPDTLTALRSATLHISTLFPDSVIKRAEEDIAQFESKGHAGTAQSKGRYHPYERQDKRSVTKDSRSDKPAWKTIRRKQSRRGRGRTATYSSRSAKGQQSYK